MGANSRIEWTNATWNPVTGCTPVSAGCANCYARRMARRLAGHFGYPEAPHHFDVMLHPDRIEQPLKWRKPRMVFICSMSDLFHEDVPDDFIFDVLTTIANNPRHTFQVLTKRPSRMKEVIDWFYLYKHEYCPWPNLWLGVTTENQEIADERIPFLLQTPAAVRFVSCEPLLEPVDLWMLEGCEKREVLREELGIPVIERITELPGLDWVIVGGESGPNARPMHPDWARSLRDQCQVAGVPFFFKQWGGWVPNEAGCGGNYHFKSKHTCLNLAGEQFDGWMEATGEKIAVLAKATKKAAGRLLDGRTWDQMPREKARASKG